MKKTTQTQIYIGLNDADSHEQIFATERYMSILKDVCRNYHVAFSVNTVSGGYFHDDGSYVEENTLVLTLMDTDKEIVEEIAKDLCVFFHQESVMVSNSTSEVFFIEEKI